MEEWQIANRREHAWFVCTLLVVLASSVVYSYEKVQNQVSLLCISKTGNLREIHISLADHMARVRKSIFLFPDMEANNGCHSMSHR
jgi:hypothetical protein